MKQGVGLLLVIVPDQQDEEEENSRSPSAPVGFLQPLSRAKTKSQKKRRMSRALQPFQNMMLNLVNVVDFRITMETNLWVYLEVF